jgi:tetratricopeptide (TPR) repeat protein
MSSDAHILPPLSPEQRRVAAGQFDRATQALAAGGHDYAIQLLLSCCQIDPANLLYRQALRRAQKAKYRNNLRGGLLSFLINFGAKARFRSARRAHDYLRMLEFGEQILVRNPWDTKTQIDMARAAQILDLLDLAIWILEEARQKNPLDHRVNQPLAQLYEKRGIFQHAAALTSATNAQPVTGDGNDKDADLLESQIAKDPTNPKLYHQLAQLYRQTGKPDQAREVLLRGLGPAGRAFDLTAELADLDIDPFRQNLAIVEEKLAAPDAPAETAAIRLRLLKEINTRELDLFRQKADRFPRNDEYRFELGVRLFRAGRLEEAIEEFEELGNTGPYQWRTMLYLGFCYQSRNNWLVAERHFEAALLHLPDEQKALRKELLYQLAAGAADAGDLAKALDLGQGLAALDPDFRNIVSLVREWETRLDSSGNMP